MAAVNHNGTRCGRSWRGAVRRRLPRARVLSSTIGLDPWDAGPLRFARLFDALNVMGLVPAQQGRTESYELKLVPSLPLSCFLNMSELFGFGRPFDLHSLPAFPRREPVISCDEWAASRRNC